MQASLNNDTNLMVLKREVDAGTCQKIIDVATEWDHAKVEGGSRENLITDKTRKSKIFWTDEKWVVDKIWRYMDAYNEITGLNYNVTRWESIQITKYEKGDHYGFHIDGKGSHNNTDDQGTVRKISMTIQLNEDYEGGNFEIAYIERGKLKTETVEKSTGTILMFPSNLHHRVKPVTAGTRYSLVAWFAGPPFK